MKVGQKNHSPLKMIACVAHTYDFKGKSGNEAETYGMNVMETFNKEVEP